jgi:hypothetical protein
MYRKPAGGRWLELILFSISALFLYHTGFGTAFFLIPLQVVASRRGTRGFLAVAGLFMAGYLGLRLVPLLRNGEMPLDLLTLLETGIVVLLLLGLLVVNVPLGRRPRTLALVAAAAAAFGAISVPVALLLTRSPVFQKAMADLSTEASDMLRSFMVPAEVLEATKSAFREVFSWLPRIAVAGYVALLSFSWWAGQAVARRSVVALYGERPRFRFADFLLESGWLWPLIGAGALVLADMFFGISFWAYAAWNVAFALLFLYGLQGLAIVRFVFEKHGVPRFLWLVLIAVVAGVTVNSVTFSMFEKKPAAGLFVMIALSVFGVSENWIRYRVPRGAAPVEKS